MSDEIFTATLKDFIDLQPTQYLVCIANKTNTQTGSTLVPELVCVFGFQKRDKPLWYNRNTLQEMLKLDDPVLPPTLKLLLESAIKSLGSNATSVSAFIDGEKNIQRDDYPGRMLEFWEYVEAHANKYAHASVNTDPDVVAAGKIAAAAQRAFDEAKKQPLIAHMKERRIRPVFQPVPQWKLHRSLCRIVKARVCTDVIVMGLS
jgi:hypothetical protein